MRHLSTFPAALAVIPLLLLSCGPKPTEVNSQAAVNHGATPADYSPRIGIALRAGSKTCVQVGNANVQQNTPVVLVSPMQPQSFEEAQIFGPSSEPCPIAKDAPPNVSNYSVTLNKSSSLPKMSPLIAVLGSAASYSFTVAPAGVQADLDQNQSKDTFRACGADDGIHLTAWNGAPLTGTRLWGGHFYEPGNPGTLPACSVAETR